MLLIHICFRKITIVGDPKISANGLKCFEKLVIYIYFSLTSHTDVAQGCVFSPPPVLQLPICSQLLLEYVWLYFLRRHMKFCLPPKFWQTIALLKASWLDSSLSGLADVPTKTARSCRELWGQLNTSLASTSQSYRTFIHNVWGGLTKLLMTAITQHMVSLPGCHRADSIAVF